MIINLHGFNSAGNNNTFDQLKAFFGNAVRVISPSYSVHNFSLGIAELIREVDRELASSDSGPLLFVGSSTGAVFAETLAKCYRANAVLINPVTNPGILKGALGWNKNYRTEVEYEFTEQDLATFRATEIDWNTPRLVLVEKDDPVIDHSLTRAYYEGHARYVEYPGDSHRFTFWDEGLKEIRGIYNA